MSQPIIKQVKQICQAYDIVPSRSKGQNFLISQKVLEQIAAAADLSADSEVLEVGPGLGILTELLVKKARRVISVELDKKLFVFLQSKFSEVKNLELINYDILEFQAKSYKLKALGYKVVANLPYNITSNFLKKFLTSEIRPKEMALLVQKEVAQRICAKPGQMSLLAVSIQLYGQPKIISVVDKNNFWPSPEVNSAVIKIEKIKSNKEVVDYLKGITEQFFWQVVKIGFSAKRKQLQNNLAAGLKISHDQAKKVLKKANFDPQIRAQSLSITDWVTLAKSLSSGPDYSG